MLNIRKIALALLFSCFATFAHAAGSTVNALPSSGAVVGSQLLYCPIGASSDLKCTFTQVATFLNSLFSGDCTVAAGGAVTCTKTNSVAFAASATSDTTNAANITSGALPAGRLPALTGDCTTSIGTVATTCTKTSGVSFGALATVTPGTNVATAAALSLNGTGAIAGTTSPVFVTPALGTPASGVATNLTGLPIAGITGLGANVGTALGSALNGTGALSATTSPVFVTPALGTPASGVGTNLTGIPIGSGISGLGTGVATAAATNLSANGGFTSTIASGATAMGTGAISSGTCATVVTATATNTATTDVITASFNGDPTGVTGYTPVTSGALTIFVYPTLNTANFKVCNLTASSVTPGAVTLNWRVVR